MMYFNDGLFCHSLFGGLFHILFWGILIFLAIWLLRCTRGTCGHCKRSVGSSALDILKERYAKGELGKEEFDQKKKDLSE